MGGRGSGSGGMGRGGVINTSGVTIREGMSPQEVDTAHTRIANLAREASEDRDNKMNRLSQQAISGEVPVSEVPGRMEAINKEYDDVMNKLRADNDKLARLYGVFQSI